jgi:hypothetical protein
MCLIPNPPRRLFSGAVVASTVTARGQQSTKVYRIGVLGSSPRGTPQALYQAFLGGLAELGYADGLSAEELDRVIQSAVARIERQRIHLTYSYASPSQMAEVRSRLAGMIEGLELLRAGPAHLP